MQYCQIYNVLEELRPLIEENFPNESYEDIEKKFRVIKLKANYWPSSSEPELYIFEFRGTVLRVGVRLKGTKEACYFGTPAMSELYEGLHMVYQQDNA